MDLKVFPIFHDFFLFSLFLEFTFTMCPRCLAHSSIAEYYTQMDKSSWTYSDAVLLDILNLMTTLSIVFYICIGLIYLLKVDLQG